MLLPGYSVLISSSLLTALLVSASLVTTLLITALPVTALLCSVTLIYCAISYYRATEVGLKWYSNCYSSTVNMNRARLPRY